MIGVPLIIPSLCIFLDMVFNAEIRSNLALLAGDEPTSRSANFGRGLIILIMIMPFSAAMYLNKNKILMVGDTVHDHEVAIKMGVDCALLDYGHNNRLRLEHTGCTVFSNIKQLIKFIN